jgi:rhodanese-related sulfurtransferase
MREQGVEFFFGETVAALEPDQAGRVARVVTDRRTLDADLVILAAGVAPNADLARDTGLDIGESGGILVNECLQTSDPNIFAGGDCAEVANLVTGGPGYFPLGSMANRQGRVIGTNLSRKAALDRGAGMARFRGAVGTWCVKLFQRAAAGAGLSAQAALDRGMDVLNVHMVQLDRAHFYPEKDLMSLDLVVERGSGRVLGIQGLSGNGDALLARINPVAALLQHGAPTVEDVSTLEVAYSPPFAAAMDVVNALGNAAENLLAGRMRNVEAGDFERLWQADEVTVLDCRAAVQGGAMAEKHPGRWLSIPQDELRERLPEVPRDKPLVLVCNTGVRSFESQIVLDAAGLGRSLNLAGGMAALGRAGVDVGQE